MQLGMYIHQLLKMVPKESSRSDGQFSDEQRRDVPSVGVLDSVVMLWIALDGVAMFPEAPLP